MYIINFLFYFKYITKYSEPNHLKYYICKSVYYVACKIYNGISKSWSKYDKFEDKTLSQTYVIILQIW